MQSHRLRVLKRSRASGPAGYPTGPERLRARAGRTVARLVVLALALAGVSVQAQQLASTDSTLPLFVVMAAANAAGYDAGLDSPLTSPVRKQLRADIEALNPPSAAKLKEFYAAHHNPSASRDLSQWVSFALMLGSPPDFAFRVKPADLPPEVTAFADLRPLLAEFYKEAQLEKLWEKYRPIYEDELTRYNEGLAQVMLEVNGYLRLGSSAFLGRDFSIYVDLLGAPEQANARSFGRDYYVVLSRAAQPQLDEVRHGYLHYVLDPISQRYGADIRAKADLKLFAEGAHALDPVLRNNFRLLLSESLIRAMELRLAKMPPATRQARLHEALTEGHILAPYFFEALEQFEKQEAGMRIYYPDMIEKIDVGKEQKRLAKVTFREAPAKELNEAALIPGGAAAGVPPRPGETRAPAGSPEEEKLLAEGEDAMARQDFARARQSFQNAAALRGHKRGQAVYGLGLVATQERQPELAKTYFQQAIELSRDPRVVAWANIYVARIYDMEENRELAIKHYQQALESGKNEPGTRAAAERGLQAPFHGDPRPGSGPEATKP